MVAEADVSVNHPIGLGKAGLRRWMHSVLRMEKMFSAMALSYGFARLDMDGVMPYCVVRAK